MLILFSVPLFFVLSKAIAQSIITREETQTTLVPSNRDDYGRPNSDLSVIPNPKEKLSTFRYYKLINPPDILVPTVVEVPFNDAQDNNLERYIFAVYDEMLGSFENYYLNQSVITEARSPIVSSTPAISDIRNIADGDPYTFAEFPFTEGETQVVTINLFNIDPIKSSRLITTLDDNVYMPKTIEIRVLDEITGQQKTVLSKTTMSGLTTNFPMTTAKNWIVRFEIVQPLRITDLRLVDASAQQQTVRGVRFLAQPGHLYEIYFDPDTNISIPVNEGGNLRASVDVLVLPDGLMRRPNPLYVLADDDKDNVPNMRDNCLDFANTDQLDINRNGVGDVCEDFDRDGIRNGLDNCQNIPNRNQADRDNDGLGDVCDIAESRITEKYVWLPWIGIVFAMVVLIVLFAVVARKKDQ